MESRAAAGLGPAGPRPKREGAQEPAADWSELPQHLLTRILGLLPLALEPLLVCNSLLAAALDCSRWWERCFLGMFLVTNLIAAYGPAGEVIMAKRTPQLSALLVSPGGFDALLSGFGKRAAHCRDMAIDELVDAALVPRLLAVAQQGSPNLAKLDLRGTFAQPGDMERVMQDVAGLQQLTRLQLAVHAARQPEHGGHAQMRMAAWAALCPLSRLARLQSLELSRWGVKKDAAPDILGSLGRLTELSIRGTQTTNIDVPAVAWIQPDGSGPRLRRLALRYCGVAEASASPDALAELGRLKLTAKLKLSRFQLVFSVAHWDFPQIRCLTRLTALKLAYSFGPLLLPPACCGLPALERLVVTACPNYNAAKPELPAEFSSLQSMRHLDLSTLDFGGLPPALAALPHVTRLGVSLSAVCDAQALAAAAFLPRLRDLILYAPKPARQVEEEGAEADLFTLPGALALATCLEQLDLGPCRSALELAEGDAGLLGSLPALRTLVLPYLQQGGEEEEEKAERLAEQQEVAAHVRAQLGAVGVAVEASANDGYPSI